MPDDKESTLEETRKYVEDLAVRRTRGVPASAISAHVIRITEGADFPVRRAAYEAITRRWEKAHEEELVVIDAPTRSSSGRYVIGKKESSGRRKRASARPYETIVEDANELKGQCSCPDFLKGSLALCKHLVVAFVHALKQPPPSEKRRRASAELSPASVLIRWDPVMPLLGPGDRLSGLHAEVSEGAKMPEGFKKNGEVDRRVLLSGTRRLAAMRGLLDRVHKSPADPTRIDAGPAVVALLESEIAISEREQRALAESDSAIRALGSLKRGLFPYQREAVVRMLKSGRLLLADDMGLGKTTQAIAVCHALYTSGRVTRGLVITPATLKNQWLREWEATTDTPAVVVDGNAQERAEIFDSFTRGFLILNYEMLLRDFEKIAPLATELVVVDEAQRIKNYATKSAVYVKALPAERRMILTGTPMENNLDELASLLDWIDDRALAPKWRLAPWYIQYSATAAREKIGMRNLGTLRARMSGSVVRRTRKEVLGQLPKRTDTRVPVPMTPEQRSEHDELYQPIVSLMARAAKRPLKQQEFLQLMSLLTQQRIISNGLGQLRFEDLWPTLEKRPPSKALIDTLYSPKLDELRRLIEVLVIDQGRKVVVFSQWRRMLRLSSWVVSDLLAAAGLRSLFFTGAESSKMRTQSLVDFHDDPTARVLFLTDAGGVGLNLQRAANACVNVELPWNPAVLEQRIARIYRLGQEQPIDVFNLVAEPGIESRIAQIVGAKRQLFEGVFESSSSEIRFEAVGSFIAEVRQLLDLQIPTAPEIASMNEAIVDTMLEAMEHHEADAPDGAAVPEVDDADTIPKTSPSELLVSGPGRTRLASAPDSEVFSFAADAETSVQDSTPPESLAESSVPLSDDDTASPSHSSPTSEPAAPLDAASMTALLGGMRVSSTPDGGLKIEAPREAAGALASVFEVMARALRAQAG